MNSIKNKREAKPHKKKTTSHSSSSNSGTVIIKKSNGDAYKAQNASTQEFFLLKEIAAGYKNENLATLLGTTSRTIQNKKNNGEHFDISQTERLRKLNQLFKEGNELFGNKEEFNEWLQKPSYGLDNNIPSELLKQPGGLDKVMTELNSIKFGDAI
jgi:putative toxin-antitoxin system antitoxin component (TIGR02293 family)